jgi:hypothetical protein
MEERRSQVLVRGYGRRRVDFISIKFWPCFTNHLFADLGLAVLRHLGQLRLRG